MVFRRAAADVERNAVRRTSFRNQITHHICEVLLLYKRHFQLPDETPDGMAVGSPKRTSLIDRRVSIRPLPAGYDGKMRPPLGHERVNKPVEPIDNRGMKSPVAIRPDFESAFTVEVFAFAKISRHGDQRKRNFLAPLLSMPQVVYSVVDESEELLKPVALVHRSARYVEAAGWACDCQSFQ